MKSFKETGGLWPPVSLKTSTLPWFDTVALEFTHAAGGARFFHGEVALSPLLLEDLDPTNESCLARIPAEAIRAAAITGPSPHDANRSRPFGHAMACPYTLPLEVRRGVG